MTDTPHLALPLLAAAQAQKHVTHNEALARIDALVQLAVLTRSTASPPGFPASGARYLVPASASGGFAGHEGEIAWFDAGVWRFLTPRPGWMAFVGDESACLVHDGTDWLPLGDAIGAITTLAQLGIGTGADPTNRLAVKAAGTLFTAKRVADGGTGDMRVAIDKEAAADTGAILFQTDYSGRAECGLAGDDDFRVKVSADGTTWHDAIRVARATGVVSFPSGASGVGGGGAAPAYAEYTANANITAAIPYDDTIPQSGEGTEILSVSITPSSTAKKVRIRWIGWMSVSAATNVTAALFVNAGADAVHAAAHTQGSANWPFTMALEFVHAPASTATQTYRLRIGPQSGVTLRLNGSTASRFFGGAARSTLVAEEID